MTTEDTPIRVLGFAGSLRQASYNRALLRAAQSLLPTGMRLDIFDLIDLPLYNGDVEAAGTPASVLAFRRAMWSADALLIASPEYNFSVTGALKNALDWASRRIPDGASPLDRLPAALMGAGGMQGALRSQLHLREILSHNDVHVLNRPTLLVARAGRYFDEDLKLTDEEMRERLARMLEALRDWTRQLQSAGLARAAAVPATSVN